MWLGVVRSASRIAAKFKYSLRTEQREGSESDSLGASETRSPDCDTPWLAVE